MRVSLLDLESGAGATGRPNAFSLRFLPDCQPKIMPGPARHDDDDEKDDEDDDSQFHKSGHAHVCYATNFEI